MMIESNTLEHFFFLQNCSFFTILHKSYPMLTNKNRFRFKEELKTVMGE